MTILLATLLATSLVAHLIHFLVFRNKFFLVRQSFIDEIVKLKNNNDSYSVRISGQLESKDQEIQRLKDALRTRAENELRRISESSKEIDTLKVLNNDLKLKAICASDLYNVELEKHKVTIETLQNNFASYKAEKESKIDKLNEELTSARVRYESIYNMIRKDAYVKISSLNQKIASLSKTLKDAVKHKDKKIRALEDKIKTLEAECLECQRRLERSTAQGNQKTALIEDLRTQINRQAERFNLHVGDALKGIDLETKDKEIERLTELVSSYKFVNVEASKADTDRRNKVNSLINYTAMGGLTKTEIIAKLQDLI